MKASEILQGGVPLITKNIQSNWGEWLGYVQHGPISKTSDGFTVATGEAYSGGDYDDYTLYHGFWVENDTSLNPEDCFVAVWNAWKAAFLEAKKMEEEFPLATKIFKMGFNAQSIRDNYPALERLFVQQEDERKRADEREREEERRSRR